ncbi:hypothetical protein F2Q68_00044957 [Brassica cretica]|uniref:Uncharacterized protein n=1 Tax=Brassica cretica TaxID=69181 RepID=A0A8S9LU80_BRACR|nr:hypothetical protein F2Q68_00044957 [Brassica cretica]
MKSNFDGNFDGESSATTKRKIEAKSLREPPEKDLDPEIEDNVGSRRDRLIRRRRPVVMGPILTQVRRRTVFLYRRHEKAMAVERQEQKLRTVERR